MVGLFKKLSKKKSRNSKRNPNVSEDESCTEDEGPEKVQHYSPAPANTKSGNGICNITPNHVGKGAAGNSCSPLNSNSQNSSLMNFDGIGDDMKDSFDFGNGNDDDDALSINSTEEGSLFDEDILSQFQDGQISLQQFLQSPHLSRSEERIRDEEIDSFFSDSRSVESSNYYSDSSSGSNRTEQRDEELDRIAGELFGDYGDKFSNTDDRFAIAKTNNDGNTKGVDSHSLDEYSIGDQTIANSFSTLTITADDDEFTNFNGVNNISCVGENKACSFSPPYSGKDTKVLSRSNPRPIDEPASEERKSSEISNPANSTDHTENCSSPTTLQGIKSKTAYGFYSPSTNDNPSSNLSMQIKENHCEVVQKTLLDLVHERNKAVLHEPSKCVSSVSSSYTDSPIPQGIISPKEATSLSNSRPSSAQSQLSQREVAIIENTVVSSEGQYILSSRNEACKVQSKIDPWLSYLPHWKSNGPKDSPSHRYANTEQGTEDWASSRVVSPRDMLRPGSALPMVKTGSPSNLSDPDRYIRFSTLDLDFFIPPPPVEDDVVSTVQKVDADGTSSHLEWEYEIAGSPTITPSSSVICIGNRESTVDNADPIAESLLSLLPIDLEKFEVSVSNALGEIITEIVSSRQKILNMTKVLEFQDIQIKEQRKLIDSQARELYKINYSSHTTEALRLQRSPQFVRRSEFRSYPATGRRSKELVDLENTLDKLLVQCHSLQKSSNAHPDLQVLRPISREGASSRADSNHSDDSVLEVKALLCKKIPESPANHVQIVPAKGVVYNSCKEMKDDMNAIQK